MSRYMEQVVELYDPRWPGDSSLIQAAAFLSDAMIDRCKIDGDNEAWRTLYEARKQVLKQLMDAGAAK